MTRPIPDPPALSLPPELTAVADFLSAQYAVNRGVVVTTLLTVLGALVGGSRYIRWRGEPLMLNLQLLLRPAVIAETTPWLHFVTRPLTEEAARLVELAAASGNLTASIAQCRRALEQPDVANTTRAEMEQQLKHLLELAAPCFFGGTPADLSKGDAYGSTLLLDPTGHVLGSLLDEPGQKTLLALAAGPTAKVATADYSLVLVAPVHLIDRISRDGNWRPLILPQDSAPFGHATITAQEALRLWRLAVTKGLAIRRGAAAELTVSQAGEATLNRIKGAAETAAAKHNRQAYAWAVSTCAKGAAILHVLAGIGSEIPAGTWEEAERLTNWLILLQTRCRVARPAGASRRPKFYPPRPDDPKTMKRLIEKRPGMSFRDVERNLSKRPPGHWRLIYEGIKRFPDGMNEATIPPMKHEDTMALLMSYESPGDEVG